MSRDGYSSDGSSRRGQDPFGASPRPDDDRVLHQPPNPRDIERFPPTSSVCAAVRGMLRDAADQELEAFDQSIVREHVQQCRACAVALSRAEHEVYLLQRAFAGERVDAGEPRAGFASRVLNRLVLDETSMLSREVLQALRDATVDAASPEAGTPDDETGRGEIGRGEADRSARGGRDAAGRATAPKARRGWGAAAGSESVVVAARGGSPLERSRLQPVRSLLIALSASVLLLVGLVALDAHLEDAKAPQSEPRMVVVSAAEAYAEFGRRLGSGQSLGEDETMMVGGRGNAEVNWHDKSNKSQPAARLHLGSNGQLRLHEGAPMLLRGDVHVETRRAVTVPMADGSALALGEGRYRIQVDPGAAEQAWQEAPPELHVSVEVLDGEGVEIIRPRWGSTLVAAGHIGVYGTSTSTESSTSGNPVGIGETVAPRQSAPPTTVPEAMLRGAVYERSGLAASGVDVVVAFLGSGAAQSRSARTGLDGRFAVAASDNQLGNFAIVHALPPSSRLDLGLKAPAAYPLLVQGGDLRLAQNLVLQPSTQFVGLAVDEHGQGRHGVRVVPCVVDEWFGTVLVWSEGQASSNALGEFRIRRLPFDLPAHQHLALLLLHPDLQPTVAPIPVRGEVAALAAMDPIRMPERRSIDVRGLLPNTSYLLLEEVAGLPGGRAVWQRTERTDYLGRLPGLRVGADVIWAQEVGSGFVRELRFSGQAALRVYQPYGPALLRSAAFGPMEPVPGTDLLVASSFRHALLDSHLFAPAGMAGSQPVQFVDAATGHAVPSVEVFSVLPQELRGAQVRFAGFAGIDENGDACITSMRTLPTGVGLFAMAEDGRTGWVPHGIWDDGNSVVQLREPGRVLVEARHRPGTNSSTEVLVLRFERAEPTLQGLAPVAVRFACAANGWEVRGVPPGDYRVLIGENAYSIEVPSGGFVRLD